MSRFQTTRWSLIAAAATEAPARARPALEQLCLAYYPPVLAYIRHCGHRDAEDLAQAFFLHLLERDWCTRANPARGRFRALMLASLRTFLADHDDRARTRWHLAAPAGDEQASRLPDRDGPEQAFTRAWLAVLLERAVNRLQREWQQAGRQLEFDRIGPLLLLEEADQGELKALARAWGLRANTLAVRVHRMRTRLRQLARLELLQTVDSQETLEAELADLRGAIGASP